MRTGPRWRGDHRRPDANDLERDQRVLPVVPGAPGLLATAVLADDPRLRARRRRSPPAGLGRGSPGPPAGGGGRGPSASGRCRRGSHRALHLDDGRSAVAADREPAGRLVRGRTLHPAAARRTRDVLSAIRTNQGVVMTAVLAGQIGRAGRERCRVHRDAEIQAWHDLLASIEGTEWHRRTVAATRGRRGHRRASDRPGRGCDQAVVVPAPVPKAKRVYPVCRGSTRT